MMKLSNTKKNNPLALILLTLCYSLLSCNQPNKNNADTEAEQDKSQCECALPSDSATTTQKPVEKTKTSSRVTHLPYYNTSSFTPRWLNPTDPSLSEFHSIPDFTLTDQDGNQISEKTVEDKIYIVSFFFTTCPGICTQMTQQITQVQTAYTDDPDILLLSHSVTPDTDTIEVLKKYADKHNIQSNKWHLLTGDRSTIYSLGRKSYFIEEDLGENKTDDEFLHTENIVLIDRNRKLRGIYNGLNKTSINQLITDIATLKTEQ
ncbi:MAG: SCO family protein [Akkermansiaceae bacterium]